MNTLSTQSKALREGIAEAIPTRVAGSGGSTGVPLEPHAAGGGSGFFADPARLGLWLFLGTITMLFVGFTSAYMVRRASQDWSPIRLPYLIWINTAVLVGSSLTIEAARRCVRSGDRLLASNWVT